MKHIFVLVVLAGCEGLTSTPKPAVSVLRQTEAGCFGLMTTDTPVAPVLGVPALCTDPVPPRLFAADDHVEVVVDYGPDVDFAGAPAAPKPVVTVTVDGAASDQPIEISKEHRVGGRVYFIATFIAPSTPTIDMQVAAAVDADFQATVATVFAVVLPPVELSLLECGVGQACRVTGAVGSAHVHLSILGEEPQSVIVHTLLDGEPLPDTLPPVITDVAQDHTEHTTAIPVPAAHIGAQWLITAQLAAGPIASVTATIDKPNILATLSCGSSCTLVRGGTVGLLISAPGQIRPLEALVDTALDGVPQIVDAPVTLVVNADGTATGQIALPVPNAPGTWQIEASVAGYFPEQAIVNSIP
jgi:hypothetical protein